MELLAFTDVAKLLNRSGNTSIDLQPSRVEQSSGVTHWAVYAGTLRSGGISFSFKVVYLHADSSTESIRAAARFAKANQSETVQVVFPASLAEKQPSLIKILGLPRAQIMTVREYLLSFLRQQLDAYLEKIKALTPKYYVEPYFKVPAGVRVKNPNPVLGFLKDRLLEGYLEDGAIGVLLAEPGQGKTYMTRFLASNLTEADFIPIYIHSEQWYHMQPDDLSSLWKTIVHSFRYFETPIGWIEGNEEEFVKVTLKAGVFRIIFDGFDEYVLWNRGKVSATEALRSLFDLAGMAGTRILITSRTSFWSADLDVQEQNGKGRVLTYSIQPFDSNNARNYFKKRFPGNAEKVNKAIAVFEKLKERSSESAEADFVGRGFFLYLIADLVDRDISYQEFSEDVHTITQWVTRALCEREVTRQQLPISTEVQIAVLKDFAEQTASGDEPTTALLKFIVKYNSGLPDVQVDELVGNYEQRNGKLKDHPLIRRRQEKDRWEFVQEQIHFTFLAERLLELCHACDNSAGSTGLNRFIDRVKFSQSPSLRADVSTSVVEQVTSSKSEEEAIATLQNVVSALFQCTPGTDLSSLHSAKPLASMIAVFANDQRFRKVTDRSEKAQSLPIYFPSGALKGAHFTTRLASMNFSGMEFKDCTFEDTDWVNCKFDNSTVFDSCRVIGGTIQSCEGFGLADWRENCTFDKSAQMLLSAEQVKAGKKAYSKDDLKGDFVQLVRKFMPKDGVGLRTVSERNLTRGTIGSSNHRNQIVRALEKHVLEKHSISGTSDIGYNISDLAKESVLHFASNGVFTGALALALEEASRKLRL